MIGGYGVSGTRHPVYGARGMSPVDDLVALLGAGADRGQHLPRALPRREPPAGVRRPGGRPGAGRGRAARSTSRNGLVHSLHAYFLRPGDPTVPILYEVDRIRDGRSFTTRRVVAIQHGRAIFNLQASFHTPSRASTIRCRCPARLPDPESLPDWHAALGAVQGPDRRPVRPAPPDRPALRRRDPIAAQGHRDRRQRRVAARRRSAARRSRAPRLHRHVRQRHDPARHDRAAVRAWHGTARHAAWPASTTRCGSTDRSAPTNGCCTTSGVFAPARHAVWPAGRSSPPTAGSW